MRVNYYPKTMAFLNRLQRFVLKVHREIIAVTLEKSASIQEEFTKEEKLKELRFLLARVRFDLSGVCGPEDEKHDPSGVFLHGSFAYAMRWYNTFWIEVGRLP